MDCAVIPINRSDDSYDSAVSSIVRTYEIFHPDTFYIIYAPFNKPVLKKLEGLFNFMRKYVKVELVDIGRYEEAEGETNLWRFIEFVKDLTKECKKVYLVPTAGASVVAASLGMLYMTDMNRYSIVSYIFSFGPWKAYYYPFTPRATETVLVEPTPPFYTVQDQINRLTQLDDYFRGVIGSQQNIYTRDMYELVYDLNKSVGEFTGIEVAIGEGDKKQKATLLMEDIDKGQGNAEELRKKLEKILEGVDEDAKNTANEVLNLSGLYEIYVLEEDGSKRKVEDVVTDYSSVVIDTNLLFYGIHSREIKGLTIPYCVEFEMESKVFTAGSSRRSTKRGFERSRFFDVLYSIYDALARRSRIIPSCRYYCDHAIPRIDPILLDGSLVLTSDKKAYDVWANSPLGRYATVKLTKVEPKEVKKERYERTFSLLTVGVVLKETLNADVRPLTR